MKWQALWRLDLDQRTSRVDVTLWEEPKPLRSSGGDCHGNLSANRPRLGIMSDDPKDVIEFAIRSAFVGYPKEDDPDWRSPHWIKPEECTHLAKIVILELRAKGFQIVKKAT
jgi:hypothetical protein